MKEDWVEYKISNDFNKYPERFRTVWVLIDSPDLEGPFTYKVFCKDVKEKPHWFYKVNIKGGVWDEPLPETEAKHIVMWRYV